MFSYYDPKTFGLDFNAWCKDVKNLPSKSVVVFHACAHNPTGVDPTPEQWREMAKIMKSKDHLAFMDMVSTYGWVVWYGVV